MDWTERRSQAQDVSDFYPHIYGGMARDIYVTREQFARFWSHSVEYIDALPFNSKVLDQMEPGGESLGYKISDRYGPTKYRLTIINYSHNVWVMPEKDVCEVHGIPRPALN